MHSASPPRSSRGGQRAQRLRVGEHRDRLVKRADQVLPDRVVDAGLPADRRIHHRQEGRGDLHERHAAEQRRRDEAGGVADDAAADGEERGAPVDLVAEDLVVDALDGRDRLVVLAGRNGHFKDSIESFRQRREQGGAVMIYDRCVEDDGRDFGGNDGAEPVANARQHPGLDDDVVGRVGEVDADGGHGRRL